MKSMIGSMDIRAAARARHDGRGLTRVGERRRRAAQVGRTAATGVRQFTAMRIGAGLPTAA
jgi:hypothetical protein